MSQIRRTVRQRGTMSLSIRHKCISAVEWNVQPLMPIGSPRVRTISSLQQVAESFARRTPESESAINMNPRAESLRNRNQLLKPIEGAHVEITRVKHHNRW